MPSWVLEWYLYKLNSYANTITKIHPLQYIFEVAQRGLRMRGMMQQIVATPIPKLFSCPHK